VLHCKKKQLKPVCKQLLGTFSGSDILRPVAPTPWGTGGHVPPHFYEWLGTGGHREQKNSKQEIAKYFLS